MDDVSLSHACFFPNESEFRSGKSWSACFWRKSAQTAITRSASKSSSVVCFMGRSFMFGGWGQSLHFTGLDRPAHFPRAPGHALPCSAHPDLLGACGRDSAYHLRNAARPHTRGRAQGRIGGRGLLGFFTKVTHG